MASLMALSISSLMTANPKNTLNEDTAAPELLALARGAFALAAN